MMPLRGFCHIVHKPNDKVKWAIITVESGFNLMSEFFVCLQTAVFPVIEHSDI